MGNTDTTDLRANILALVTARPGIDAEGLAEELGASYLVVDDLVAEMCKAGELAPEVD